EPAPPESLGGIAPEDAAHLTFKLHPSYGYLASPFPIDDIWRANCSGADIEASIDLAGGGVRLEVSRENKEVVFRKLDEPAFAFRQALCKAFSLDRAIELALAIDPQFSAVDALMGLFAQGAVAGVTLSVSLERTSC